jgi:hypothetical protein
VRTRIARHCACSAKHRGTMLADECRVELGAFVAALDVALTSAQYCALLQVCCVVITRVCVRAVVTPR